MEIVNHVLHQNGKPVSFRLTPNRGGVYVPKYLIIHYDASNNATGAIEWMLSERSSVSAHLHITRDGIITQLAPFNIVCWHAGKSEWEGLSGLNSHSIGIELQNNGVQDYTDIQICVCKAVSDLLVSHYKLKDVLGHSDISPGRKIDPGPKFPMHQFRVSEGNPIKGIQRALNKFGYKLAEDGIEGPGTKAALLDFQKKQGLVTDGIVGPKTLKALGI